MMLQCKKRILIWMIVLVQTYHWCLYKSTAFAGTINTIEYSPDRYLFVTTNSNGAAHLWSATNSLISLVISPGSGSASSARFSKNNTIFAVSTTTGFVYIYNCSSPYTLITSFDAGTGSGATKIDFSYDGNYLLICGGGSGSVKVYDLQTLAVHSSVAFSNSQTCKFAPNNNFGIAANSNNVGYYALAGGNIWSLAINNCIDMEINGASTTMVLACNNGANRFTYVVNIATQAFTSVYTPTANVRAAQISYDNSYIVFSGDEENVDFIPAASPSSVQYSFGILSQAYCADFSADSNYLLVGTKTGYIYQYRKFCMQCPVSRYQNLTTLQCELCSQYNRACGACINSTYCTDCIQGYYVEPITVSFTAIRGCLPCLMEGCIVCNSSTVCLRCEVGYYIDTGTNTCKSCAVPMQGCLRCNSSSICEKCSHDFYLSSNKCSVCSLITGCSLCANSSYCHVCQVGYYINGGTCSACPTNCLVCYNTTTCLDCRQGYYPTNTAAAACSTCPTPLCLSCNQTGFCYECGTNSYLDTVTGSCISCAFPCNECNGTLCLSCEPGYYLNYTAYGGTLPTDGGLCQNCDHPCVTCNSSSICISCPLGYYLVSTSYTCQPCDAIKKFCTQCTPTTCLNCTLGYFINSTNDCVACSGHMFACITCTSTSTCLKCSPGYYLSTSTGNNSCKACSIGCQLCSSSVYCYGCIDGHYLDSATNTCPRCVLPCTICNSSTQCLSCEQEYYLNQTACTGCNEVIQNCVTCDDEIVSGTIKCTSCRAGFYKNVNYTCTKCVPPCSVCSSSTSCIQCQIGYFVSGTSCQLCPQNCTACTSATACSSCSIGFYHNSGTQKCIHCTSIGCLTCNSTQNCLSCSPGYYMTSTFTCNFCASAIKYCETCLNQNLCLSCSFGYVLATGNTSCIVCSSIVGCFDCDSLTSCSTCQNGYYLVTVNGTGSCSVCPQGCASCNNDTNCITCLPSFLLQATNCVLCKQVILGCQLCTSTTTCIECSNGYYKSGSSCLYCRSAMKGCQFCNSSSVCTYCAQGYYLQAGNTCQICSLGMPGCSVCNSSTLCSDCQTGYFLDGTTCRMCSSTMPFCLSCTDNSTCLDCVEGYAIDPITIQCVICKSVMPGCVGCATLSQCQQCQAGYYLRSNDSQCIACTQTGCEICYETSATSCVSCNTMYFLSSSRCYYCRDYLQGCIECTSSSTCTLCQTGYFVNGTSKCQLCQTSIEGCGRCNNSLICYECKSTYFLNTTTNKCQTCLSAIEGCAYCMDTSQCTSCSNDYYKNSTTGFCQLCTNIQGCLACSDYNKCLLCEGDYFLELTENLCYPCNVIEGCYSCLHNVTCVVCVGGYILNDDKLCEIYVVQADAQLVGVKMVTTYIDPTALSHVVYVNKMTYVVSQFSLQQWRNRTDIILQYPTFIMENLTINSVQFIKSNQLQFFTNNPLNINLQSLPARRMLASMPEGYKTFIKMKQDIVNVILPDLYMSHNMVLDYDLTKPQFFTSIYQVKFNLYQSVFGILVIVILTINYIIRAVVTNPNAPCSEHGQILPHILALKAPPFIIYPIFPEQISFCFGFMAAQFPWAREFFGWALSDPSETIPQQYGIFYKSMSFGSTYMMAAIIGLILIVAMWLFKKNQQKSIELSSTQEINQQQLITKIIQKRKWGLPEWPIKMVMYNFFLFGLVFNGCASLQNAIINPISSITVSAVFTILGIVCFGFSLTDCLYSLYCNPLQFFKLRVFVKAVLLSLAHFSPIYIYSSSLALQLIMLIIEYRLTKQIKTHPKLWIYNNFIINLVLALLVFIHSHFVTLIIAGFFLATIMLIEIYIHRQDYRNQKIKDKNMLPKMFNLVDDGTDNTNVWNIRFGPGNQASKKQQSKQQAKRQQKKFPLQKYQSKKNSGTGTMSSFDSEQKLLHQRKNKKQKKPKQLKSNSSNFLNVKEQSIQNLQSYLQHNKTGEEGDNNNKNVFLAADFIN